MKTCCVAVAPSSNSTPSDPLIDLHIGTCSRSDGDFDAFRPCGQEQDRLLDHDLVFADGHHLLEITSGPQPPHGLAGDGDIGILPRATSDVSGR